MLNSINIPKKLSNKNILISEVNQSQDDRNDDGNQNEISMAIIQQDLNIIDSLEDSVFLESVDLDILNTLPAPVYELDDLQDEFFPTTSEPVSDVHMSVAAVSDVHVFEAPVSDVYMSWQLYLMFMCLRHLYLMFTCLQNLVQAVESDQTNHLHASIIFTAQLIAMS